MAKNEKFLKEIEASLNKYKKELSKLDSLLAKNKSSQKARLVSQSKKLKDNLTKAEATFEQLKSASQDKFDDTKKSFLETYNAMSEIFSDFSSHLTTDKLQHYKDEVTNYGCDKLCDAQDYIKKNPLTAAACALGVGFIIGKLLSRSK